MANPPDTVKYELSNFGGIYKAVVEQLEEIGAEGKIHRLSRLQSDLALDSLDGVEMVMSFEDGTGLKISDEDAQGLYFPLQIAIYLADRLGLEVPADRRGEMEARREEIKAFLEKRGPEPAPYGGKPAAAPAEAEATA